MTIQTIAQNAALRALIDALNATAIETDKAASADDGTDAASAFLLHLEAKQHTAYTELLAGIDAEIARAVSLALMAER